MSFRLTQALLEAHGLGTIPPERERDAVLRHVDQVLLDRDQAPLTVALLERAGVAAPRVRTVLVETGRADGGEAPTPADWRRLALARGMLLPRPGRGEAETLHRERLAAPGRLALCAGTLPACGAYGMLAVRVDALEAAAVLAGGALTLRTPRVWGLELAGALPPGVGGADLALAVLARWVRSDRAGEVVEFGGDGAGAMPMAERVSAAWLLGQAGLPCLFPSDEVTRAALAALGRDQDWRRLDAAAGDGEPSGRIALGSLEALVADAGAITGANVAAGTLPARAHSGLAVDRVLVGPAATVEDLACLAARLRGRHVAERTECAVVAGSRSLLDLVSTLGIAGELAEAGVRVGEGETSPSTSGAGTGLCFGLAPARLAAGRARWFVGGIEAVAAAALSGAITVPEPAEAVPPGPVVVTGAVEAEPWLAVPPRDEAPAPVAAAAPVFRWRGAVLVALGDGVEAGALLAPGARLEGTRGRLRAMAGALLAGIEPGFAERARRCGGGWVVAGTDFLRSEPAAAAAVCMAELGLWGILARSYAPGAVRALVHAGVIPFTIGAEVPARGDELEVAGLPEVLVPGHPVTARDLTRGVHLRLAHDLSAREIAIVRAGGIVPCAAGSRPRTEEE